MEPDAFIGGRLVFCAGEYTALIDLVLKCINEGYEGKKVQWLFWTNDPECALWIEKMKAIGEEELSITLHHYFGPSKRHDD